MAAFKSSDMEKCKEWILETIDHLRHRKSRPDAESICRLVEKKHPELSYDRIKKILFKLVKFGKIWRIEYKGNISYRKPNQKDKRAKKTTFCLCCFGDDCIKNKNKSYFYVCEKCGGRYIENCNLAERAAKWICEKCMKKMDKDGELLWLQNDIYEASDSPVCSTIDYGEPYFSSPKQECNDDIFDNQSINTKNWNVDEVEDFIRTIGFPEEATVFKEQQIDGMALLLMKRNDVLRGLNLHLGPALKIYHHIQSLQKLFINYEL